MHNLMKSISESTLKYEDILSNVDQLMLSRLNKKVSNWPESLQRSVWRNNNVKHLTLLSLSYFKKSLCTTACNLQIALFEVRFLTQLYSIGTTPLSRPHFLDSCQSFPTGDQGGDDLTHGRDMSPTIKILLPIITLACH